MPTREYADISMGTRIVFGAFMLPAFYRRMEGSVRLRGQVLCHRDVPYSKVFAHSRVPYFPEPINSCTGFLRNKIGCRAPHTAAWGTSACIGGVKQADGSSILFFSAAPEEPDTFTHSPATVRASFSHCRRESTIRSKPSARGPCKLSGISSSSFS